jgi:hypothetical protein
LLQWAAINNHYALCHFLIQAGAPINAKGGDAVATPVLWAAKRCNYYIVNLLLDHGADPLLTDDQGFNLLHSATLDGNVYQIVLLLHQDIPVDIPDPQSHTPLMWAAYKGYPSCVDLFLRWGANVYATDDQGFTALHWALVKGSQGSIQKLLEYGADRFAKNNDGKTPEVTAQEMNTTRQWRRALMEAGFDRNGNPRQFPIPGIKDTRWFLSRFIFFWPFAILFTALFLVSHYPAFVGIPLSLIVAYLMQWGAQWLLRWGPSNMRSIHHTVRRLLAYFCLVANQIPAFFGRHLRRHTVLGRSPLGNNSLTLDNSNQLLYELSLRSILRTHGLFLFLHHDY